MEFQFQVTTTGTGRFAFSNAQLISSDSFDFSLVDSTSQLEVTLLPLSLPQTPVPEPASTACISVALPALALAANRPRS